MSPNLWQAYNSRHFILNLEEFRFKKRKRESETSSQRYETMPAGIKLMWRHPTATPYISHSDTV